MRKGSMKKYRKDELHNQLPPDSSIERFNTKVNAKKKEEQIPRRIALKVNTPNNISHLVERD